jgi:sirohydrochlorin ferrochelatase
VVQRDVSEPGPLARRVGLVVVDHGSARQEANRWHEEFVRGWGDVADYCVVEPAHMELAEPSIGAAFDACVAGGAEVVVIAPYFLWPGRHWSEDIPRLAAEASARHPGVAYLVAAPLGPHPLLRTVVDERVRHCLAHASAQGPDCEMCVGTDGCRLS